MSEEHKMTKKDKLVLTITLAAIFFGVFGLGLIGLYFTFTYSESKNVISLYLFGYQIIYFI